MTEEQDKYAQEFILKVFTVLQTRSSLILSSVYCTERNVLMF